MATNQPKKTLAPTCWSVLEEPGMTGKLQTFPALSKPRVPQDRLITKQRVRERNRDREQPSCFRCFLPHSGPLSGERKKKNSSSIPTDERACMLQSPPQSGHHHTYILSVHANSARLFIISTVYYQFMQIQLSTPTRNSSELPKLIRQAF